MRLYEFFYGCRYETVPTTRPEVSELRIGLCQLKNYLTT